MRINASYVGHVDDYAVIAFHAVANLILIEHLHDATVGLHHKMVTRFFPSFAPELGSQVVNTLLLASCRAVHGDVFNLSHRYVFFVPCNNR